MPALRDNFIPLVQGQGRVGDGYVGLLHDAEVARSHFPTVGGCCADDVPALGVRDVLVLELPDVAREGCLVGLVPVCERCLVSREPLLEGVACESYVLLCAVRGGDGALVHQVGCLTLAVKGAWGFPAVTPPWPCAVGPVRYLSIVAGDDSLHVPHAAVADLHGVPVDVPAEYGPLLEVAVDHREEPLGHVGAHLVVPWRVEPCYLARPCPCFSTSLCVILELVTVILSI